MERDEGGRRRMYLQEVPVVDVVVYVVVNSVQLREDLTGVAVVGFFFKHQVSAKNQVGAELNCKEEEW